MNSVLGEPFDLSAIGRLVKGAYLLGLTIYVVFGLVMIKQVKQMTRTVQGSMSGPLMTLALIHLLLSIALWLVALFVL